MKDKYNVDISYHAAYMKQKEYYLTYVLFYYINNIKKIRLYLNRKCHTL